jgi:hypothetical protein
VLKVRLADMRRELHVLRTGVANVDVLKREVRHTRVTLLVFENCSMLISRPPPYAAVTELRLVQQAGLADRQGKAMRLTCTVGCMTQVASLGRQLLQERTKVKALSEELESPLNVHRSGLQTLLYGSFTGLGGCG